MWRRDGVRNTGDAVEEGTVAAFLGIKASSSENYCLRNSFVVMIIDNYARKNRSSFCPKKTPHKKSLHRKNLSKKSSEFPSQKKLSNKYVSLNTCFKLFFSSLCTYCWPLHQYHNHRHSPLPLHQSHNEEDGQTSAYSPGHFSCNPVIL